MRPIRYFPILAALALAGAAHAADPPDDAATQRRIEQLERDLRELKKDTRKIEVADEAAAKLKPLAGWDGRSFFIQTSDGQNKLQFRGYTQFDGRFFVDQGNVSNTSQFLFRRVRPVLQGKVLKYFEFKIMPDFGSSTFTLQDAYLDVRYFAAAAPRFGKFKGPVGLERLQSATALTFIDRALPTNLVPNRDLGIDVFGDIWMGFFTYEAGIFDGVPDGGSNTGDIDSDKDFYGRVFFHPFVNTSLRWLSGFGIGASGTYGKSSGSTSSPNLPSYRTDGQATFFRYVSGSTGTAIADGERARFSPQGYFYWGPFGLLWEYVSSTQGVRLNTVSDDVTNTSWQVAASYILTGEAKNYRGYVQPKSPFNPLGSEWGWGAYEIGFRWNALDIDSDAFSRGFASSAQSASKAEGFGLVASWYLNQFVKLLLDYERTTFDGGAASGNRSPENVIQTRVQLSF